jgi:hypothetical protein
MMSMRATTANKTSKMAKGAPVPKTNITGFPQPAASPAHGLALLQRSLGNQAVERLYRSALIQAKLTIGAPNDIFEQEADRVADQVMRMPGPVVQTKPG